MKIQSFEQASRKVQELTDGMQELRQFLDMAKSAIDAVNVLKGGNEQPTPIVRTLQNITPETTVDRVLLILREVGKPTKPKDVVVKYEQKGWPRPDDKREFYIMVSSTLAYLAKRKGTLIRTDEGYWFKT